MANQLNSMPSLSFEELVLRRVVINLWNETDILPVFLFEDALFQVDCPYELVSDWLAKFEWHVMRGDKWREAVEAVKVKVSKLALPVPLKKRMMHIFQVIGLEMLRWKISLHGPRWRNSKEFLDVNILKQVCWTPEGRIDYEKTAEMLVNLETLDIGKRYQLACSYHLVNYIQVIWRELPEEHKRRFRNEEDPSEPTFWRAETTLHEFYWSGILTKSEYKLHNSTNRRAFRHSAESGNCAATKYFFQKLTVEERNTILLPTVHTVLLKRYEHGSDNSDLPKETLIVVLNYLLQLLNSEQQMKIFQQHPYQVLGCFLDWPWHEHFLNVADLIWTFLPEKDYYPLLSEMAYKAEISGFYFPEVFQNFLMRSPSTFAKYEYKFFTFFPAIFYVEDIETIKIVLKSMRAINETRFPFLKDFFNILDDALKKDKFQLVRLYLLEITKLEDKNMLELKYMEFLSEIEKEREDVCSDDEMQIEFYFTEMESGDDFERRKHKWNELFSSLTGEDVSIEGSDTD